MTAWSYVNNKRYRDGADYHVRSLVDLVSRAGIFLLSLTPGGDGSTPAEEREIMRGIVRWLNTGSVSLFGHEGPLTWNQLVAGLEVTLPADLPCDYAFALRITAK
jgi:alpha-L-fucosidase